MPKVQIESEDWYVTTVSVEGEEYPVGHPVDVTDEHLETIKGIPGIKIVDDQQDKSKADLLKQAAELNIEGRSSMSKEELSHAISEAEADESDENSGSAPTQPPITAS